MGRVFVIPVDIVREAENVVAWPAGYKDHAVGVAGFGDVVGRHDRHIQVIVIAANASGDLGRDIRRAVAKTQSEKGATALKVRPWIRTLDIPR